MKKTYYRLPEGNFNKHFRLAVVSDLHTQKCPGLIEGLESAAPDYILMPGDIFEALDGRYDDVNEKTFEILSRAAKIAPTFYSPGNHEDGGVRSHSKKWKRMGAMERNYTSENVRKIKESGVHFLVDEAVMTDGILFGGLASGFILEGRKPNLDFLNEFASADVPKVLLCHHPEYYEPYIKELPIELTVSGHAHGGQWRFFGRGVYSPGQGLFPKYTSGVHYGRFVISKGLKKSTVPPRIFNPREIVIIDT